MTTLSQKNLLKLAQEDEEKGQISNAIQLLEEALSYGRSSEIVMSLCRLYRKNNQEDQAYTLIKEEPDLFSEPEIFEEYNKILVANHYLIEALQIENLLGKKMPIKVFPEKLDAQNNLMQKFKSKKEVSQFDYQSLLKLDLVNYKNFAQSLLLDPTQNFAVRLCLCEDFVRLGISDRIQVWALGQVEEFIPKETELLEKTTVYREVIGGIGDRFRNNPSQLPLMLGETNIVLGSLYPKLNKYIKDTDSFTSDLISYLETKDGRTHQKLLDRVYANLPK